MHRIRKCGRQLLATGFLAVVAIFAVASSEGLGQDNSFFALHSAAQDRTSILLSKMIRRIAGEPSAEVRMAMIDDLAMVIRYLLDEGKQDIDDSAIDGLAELLIHGDGAVRSFAAGALGAIGTTAGHVVPALEAAYAKACANRPILQPGPHEHDIIEATLRDITEHAPTCP